MLKKRNCSGNYVISLWAKRVNRDWQMCEIYESSRRCVLLGAYHYGAKQFLQYHLNLFVCLIEGLATKGRLAFPQVDWQMREIYEGPCVLLEAHHNVAKTTMKSKLHFCILFRLFPNTNVAILINITETLQIQSKSWLWPYCVLTHTK